ncbi:MAG: PTS sugar transporter subunit IIC [Fusobacteriaceae bacterium]|nr:PTS sugar transporter subunit IIC [Fusobacteriaceae bacterium]MBN2838897.1 PTS sugar transporter subunit IIC [Fusobacteriaceae bacterium]
MTSFNEKFENVLMVIAEKVDKNQYLTSIKSAFTIFMPFVIVGSFATLLNAVIASPKTGLAKWIPALEKTKTAFTALNFATMSFMTIPIIFLIAFHLAKHYKLPEYITGLLAIASYITVIPSVVTIKVDEITKTASGIPSSALGAQGLFIGMILAVIVVEIFRYLMKLKFLKIKMHESVPTQISTSFNTLLPILIVLCITSIFGNSFFQHTGLYINEYIYKIVQAPLEAIFQSPIGILSIVIFSQLFWFLGIHGGLVISPIRNPFIAAAVAANVAAVNAGQIPTQPVTYGFWMNYIVPGGAGMILSLIIAIFLFSKREDHKMIAKLGFLPGIFNISEPVVFGLPLVLNPTFAIPFIFNSAISCGIALFATKIGFLPCNTIDVPFGVPILLAPFIGHGWQGTIVQIICILVCVFTWAPFVLISNKQWKPETK